MSRGLPWAVFCKGVNGLLVDVIEGEACEVVLPYLSAQLSYVLHARGLSCAFLDRIDELCAFLGGLGGADSELPCVCRSEARGHALRSRIPLLRFLAGRLRAGWAFFWSRASTASCTRARSAACRVMSSGRGVMRDLRAACPGANIASIEFDPGTSGVNQVNRIKLMAAIAKRKTRGDRA